MKADPFNCSESEYRLQIRNKVKYLLVAPNTFDSEIVGFPPGSLPELRPFPENHNWNLGHISREPETKNLKFHSWRNLWQAWQIFSTPPSSIASNRSARNFLAPTTSIVSYTPNNASSPISVIAKIARFEFEIPRFVRETAARIILAPTDRAPKFLGHIYEGSRVAGFLLEKAEGWEARIEALEACGEALGRVHRLGMVHGDVNRYNLIVGEGRVTIVDFENRRLESDGEVMRRELESPKDQLVEESWRGAGFGRFPVQGMN